MDAVKETYGHSREQGVGVCMDTSAHAAAHHGTRDKEELQWMN